MASAVCFSSFASTFAVVTWSLAKTMSANTSPTEPTFLESTKDVIINPENIIKFIQQTFHVIVFINCPIASDLLAIFVVLKNMILQKEESLRNMFVILLRRVLRNP